MNYHKTLTGDLYDELRYVQHCMQECIQYGPEIAQYWTIGLRKQEAQIKSELQRREYEKTHPRAVTTRQEEIEQAKQVPLREIIIVLGGSVPEGAKTQYNVNCLFHADKFPSMGVNEVSGIYHCFSCHKSGKGISLVMAVKDYTFWEALDFIRGINGGRNSQLSGIVDGL